MLNRVYEVAETEKTMLWPAEHGTIPALLKIYSYFVYVNLLIKLVRVWVLTNHV